MPTRSKNTQERPHTPIVIAIVVVHVTIVQIHVPRVIVIVLRTRPIVVVRIQQATNRNVVATNILTNQKIVCE